MPSDAPGTTDVRAGGAAIRTLKRKGYTYHGGVEWKPPLGPAPDFNLLDAKNAEIERLRTLLADVAAPIEANALLDTVAGKSFRDSRTAAAIREELARGR